MSESPPPRQTSFGTILWEGSYRATMTALVLLPWDGGGTTVCKRADDGTLYGCRDVTSGASHDGIVKAWNDTAVADGLTVEDLRNGREPTADEIAGMRWWNALTEAERSKWLSVAGTAVAADAWAAFKSVRERGDG